MPTTAHTHTGTAAWPAADAGTPFDHAICLDLSLTKPGTRRKVSTSEVEEVEEMPANPDWISIYKDLFHSPEFDAIKSLDSKIRRLLTTRALPSPLKRGTYLVPLGLLSEVDDCLRHFLSERSGLIREFLATYPKLKEKALESLGELYNAAQFPSEDQQHRGFSASYRLFSFGLPSKLEGIAPDIFHRERRKTVRDNTAAATEVRLALRREFSSLAERLAHTLAPHGKRRMSLQRGTLEQLFDFLATFPDRNLVGDDDLARRVREAAEMLTEHGDVQQVFDLLHDDETHRWRVVAWAEATRDELSGLVKEDRQSLQGLRELTLLELDLDEGEVH